MKTVTTATLIRKYLETFEGTGGSRLLDVVDDDVFEVLAGVAWVREALAEFLPSLEPADQQDVLSGLRTLAA